MVFGYARVSTKAQKLDLQVDALLSNGVDVKNIYSDIASGVKSQRSGLDELLGQLRKDDIVVVWKMDRIARSISHLVKLLDGFQKKGVRFKSIQEPFIDTTSAHGKFITNIFGAFAQLERDLIVERTRAGLESSRRRGIQLGRKKGLGKEAKKKAILAASYYKDNNLTVEEIMKLVEVRSKRTLYKYLAYEGRRNCFECRTIFWDKNQPLDSAYCDKHSATKDTNKP
ncbi:recombinase family protein [Maribacter polysaccharolyticus]|uniref:recombinase family protein n=1 Tax=Maribacter polysaccharolyticus TaxID=3020831 RepID=UPI00237F102D|nr:recombinase family protein [Maribacter polysaccharolyticus]MDE3743998.1 recombinase family protein [Maribacter polysaccharolyticus]